MQFDLLRVHQLLIYMKDGDTMHNPEGSGSRPGQKEGALRNSKIMLNTLLDSLEAVVYVTDIKTNEILYINEYTRDMLGDIEGEICWKTIQAGQTGPCDFCTNNKLLTPDGVPSGVYHWEFQNTVNKRWYDIRDRALEWIDGRIVRLEIATDITERKQAEEERDKLIIELKDALSKVKTLSGMLPICASCNSIRDDSGYWNKLADYISAHSDAELTHSICPDCARKLYPDQFKDGEDC